MSALVDGPWLVVGGKLVLLVAVYFAGLSVSTLLHELGHAFAALFFTKQRVQMQWGRPWRWRLLYRRFEGLFGLKGLQHGFTRYDRDSVARSIQTLVALSGPLASAGFCLLFVGAALWTTTGSWWWVVWLGLIVANFRILIVSMWPIAYRPEGPDGEVWLSDALDIWRMWSR